MIHEYSENELKLFEKFGYGQIAQNLTPHPLYRLCVEKAFIGNLTGSYVEALRRAYAALESCKIYRMTSQFEELLRFDD